MCVAIYIEGRFYMIIEYIEKYYNDVFYLLNSVFSSNITKDCLEENYIRDNKKILLYVVDDKAVACALVEFRCDYVRAKKIAFITYFAVDEKYHRRGIGRELFEYIEKMCINIGVYIIELTSANHRLGAHQFYNAIGFTKKATTVFIKELNG